MPATASVRDLRNRFPHVRKIIESQGEVLLTENGETRYRLVLHTPAKKKAAPAVNYWERLTAHQPVPMSAAQAQSLHDENRGDR